MGTSSKYTGPTGRRWSGASSGLAEPGPNPVVPAPRGGPASPAPMEEVAARGERYLAALRDSLRDQPDLFGLRDAFVGAGGRLVDVLAELSVAGPDVFALPTDEPEGSRAAWFVLEFVRAVAADGGLVVDAVVRKAATRCAERILDDPGMRDAVDNATVDARLSGDLLCAIFEWFFARAVSELVRAIIAEKINLMVLGLVPGLRVVDPDGQIADWVAGKVMELVPNPCERAHELAERGLNVVEVARELIPESVDRALGVWAGEEPS